MKKNLLLFLILIISFSCYGQKYKLKKDVLLKDKVPVAKVEGKVNIVKKDLSIMSIQGEPLLIVSGKTYSAVPPEMEAFNWYTFRFPTLNKEILMKESSGYFNTGQFLKHEFQNKGIHFYADGLHADELDVLEDYSQQLQADTMQLIEFFRFHHETLSVNHVERPAKEPLKYLTFQNSSDLAITQGKDENGKPIIIGKIEYSHNPGMSSSDPSRHHRARIYKKLPQKIMVDGKEIDYLVAGYIDLLKTFPVLFLYQNGRELNTFEYKIDEKKIGLHSAKAAAEFMVSKGYL